MDVRIIAATNKNLEKEVADFAGAHDAVACASGTDALWLALVATGIQPGDAVATTAFSFFASASSIARIGARPAFVDIDPRTFNLDIADLAAKLKAGFVSGAIALPDTKNGFVVKKNVFSGKAFANVAINAREFAVVVLIFFGQCSIGRFVRRQRFVGRVRVAEPYHR